MPKHSLDNKNLFLVPYYMCIAGQQGGSVYPSKSGAPLMVYYLNPIFSRVPEQKYSTEHRTHCLINFPPGSNAWHFSTHIPLVNVSHMSSVTPQGALKLGWPFKPVLSWVGALGVYTSTQASHWMQLPLKERVQLWARGFIITVISILPVFLFKSIIETWTRHFRCDLHSTAGHQGHFCMSEP